MKKFNLAALPLAVAGVLASNAAFAGTEACFEVYKGGNDFVVSAFATPYDLASCTKTDVSAATDTTLAADAVTSIAYELTGVNPTTGDKVFELSFEFLQESYYAHS